MFKYCMNKSQENKKKVLVSDFLVKSITQKFYRIEIHVY